MFADQRGKCPQGFKNVPQLGQRLMNQVVNCINTGKRCNQ